MFIKLLLISLLIFSFADAKSDSSALQDKKRTKMIMMGQRVYSVMCDQDAISKLNYKTPDDLKTQIRKNHLCSGIKSKNLQEVVLFLTSKKSSLKKDKIDVPKGAKCPVCGMFVDKYPKWVAFIDGRYFDGVKDMMKFYLDPERFSAKKENFSKILVSDYYTLKPILAKKAWFVVGSNIYGPMGSELIPFSSEEDAKAFFDEHKGQKIVKFDEITEDLVYKLDQ
jgi:nitrous oxide reductase accessory protein NosL